MRPRNVVKAARVNVTSAVEPISDADASVRSRMLSWTGPEAAFSSRPDNTRTSFPAFMVETAVSETATRGALSAEHDLAVASTPEVRRDVGRNLP